MNATTIFPAIIIAMAGSTGYVCAQVASRMALSRGPAREEMGDLGGDVGTGAACASGAVAKPA